MKFLPPAAAEMPSSRAGGSSDAGSVHSSGGDESFRSYVNFNLATTEVFSNLPPKY